MILHLNRQALLLKQLARVNMTQYQFLQNRINHTESYQRYAGFGFVVYHAVFFRDIFLTLQA